MKKICSLILALVLVMSLAAFASAEGIIYIITPSTSNPFFKTEQDVGAPAAEALGYEAKAFPKIKADEQRIEVSYIK